ncbi:MAG: peptidylprolyl isomerase [Candidatus Zixiibacteriota bacterium]
MRTTLARLLALSAILAIFALGCGSKNWGDTVATVGGYDITTDEFLEYMGTPPVDFNSAQEEFDKRREILDTMIVTRLLIQSAYEKGIDKDPEISRIVEANKEKFLLDNLYFRNIREKTHATETEIKAFWENLADRLRVCHILVKSEDSANMILDKLRAGENFEEVAYTHSADPSAKKNRGDLGYILWGAFVDEFQDVAFKMQAGEVSPPVKSAYGWHIIKVIDRLPNDSRQPFETMKSAIKSQLENRKSYRAAEIFMKEIKAKYPITVDTVSCQYLLKKRETLYPPELLASLPRNDFDLAQLDRNEKELVLATWDGGQITVQQYLDKIKSSPREIRPDFDNFDSLRTVIFELKKGDLLAIEAIRSGMDNDPRYVKKISLFKEYNMAEVMKSDSMPTPPDPDDATVRMYYDAHPEEFSSAAKVQVYEILLSDEPRARQLKKSIKSLAEFKEMAMDLTERPGKREARGELGYIEKEFFPDLFDEAWRTSIGAIGGPIQTMGRYSIIYVVDKIEASQKDYLSVKPQIVGRLVSEQKTANLQQWIADRKNAVSIDVDDDALWATVDKEKYASAESGKTN